MEKRIYSKLKYYFKEIKTNAKVFYDEEAYDREFGHFRFSDILFCVTIIVITPLTILSFLLSEALMYVCCFFWACVLYYILAILFRNL